MSESNDDDLGFEGGDRASAETLRERRRTRRLRRALRVPVDEVPRPAGRPEDGAAAAPQDPPAVVATRSVVVAARIVTISAPTPPAPTPHAPLTDSADELDVDLDVEPVVEAPTTIPTARGVPAPAVALLPPPDHSAFDDAMMRSVEVPLDSSVDEIDTIPPAAEPDASIDAMPRPPRMPDVDESDLARLSTPDLTDVLVEDEGRLTPMPEQLRLPSPSATHARSDSGITRPMTPPPPPPRPPSIPPPAAASVRTPSMPPPSSMPPSAVPVLSEALLGEGAPSSTTPSTGIAAATPPIPPSAPLPYVSPQALAAPAPTDASAAPPPPPSSVSASAQPEPSPVASAVVLTPVRNVEIVHDDGSLDPHSDQTSAEGLTHDSQPSEAAETPTVPRKKKKRHKPWWDDFFNDDYLRTFVPPSTEQTRRQADFIDDSLGLAPGAAVLDIGCGQGRHAIELASRGYKVVGLDLSIPMLATAGELAQEAGVKINFIHGDMREMTFESAFDGVSCFDTTFGFFDDEVNKDVIARVHKALRPGGMFLLDVVNRDFVMRHQPNLVWFEGDGCVCMEETDMNYITSRLLVKRTIILEDGRQKMSEYSVRLYSLHELGQLLHNLGFRVAEVSGRLTTPGVFFGAESPRLVILAEKRASDAFGPATGVMQGLPGGLSPSTGTMPAVANPTAPPKTDPSGGQSPPPTE